MHRPLLLALALLALLAPPAGATWSIIVINHSTREVAIGSATCLTQYNLKKLVPAIRVERGAVAAQSFIKAGSLLKAWDGLIASNTPNQILDTLLTGDNNTSIRQYGIVSFAPTPSALGFSGFNCGSYAADLTGSAGELTWAIQGNVLTGAPVLLAAQQALIDTTGTLADKLMASMSAAYTMGGDGRCSCLSGEPDSCGSPPVNGFTKSAHIGFMVVARPGDIDGECTTSNGCANGDYWLSLNVAFETPAKPDPVLQMQGLYANFLASASGHADGLASSSAWEHDEVVGDGNSTARLHLALSDVHGQPLLQGGAAISLTHAAGSAGLASLLAVEDHGDGSYELLLQAGAGEGLDRLAVRIDDGFRPATIFPYPELLHRPSLVSEPTSVSTAQGGTVSFDVLAPTGYAGRRYGLALSAAGSVPGHSLNGVLVPLNPDRLFALSPALAALGLLDGVPGVLSARGQAAAALDLPAGPLTHLVGHTLTAAWFTLRPLDYASNAVHFTLDP
ncbi:MAG: DUF1028 domain-containing protein [Planctomycetota bacterium]